MRPTIGMVIVDNGEQGNLEPRHVPQRGRAKNERAVTDEANDLLVRTRELDPRRRADPRAEMSAVVKEQLAPSHRIEIKRMQGYRSRLVHDDCVGVGEIPPPRSPDRQ